MSLLLKIYGFALPRRDPEAPPPRALQLILTSFLHSGVWILSLVVALTYFIYVRYQAPWKLWFIGSFYVCLLLFAVLLFHLIRLDFNAPERQKRSPVFSFARITSRKRNHFIFCYILFAAIGLPWLVTLRETPQFMVFATLVSLAGVHFFAWYVWQFMGPVLEKGAATSATLTDSNGA